MNFKVRYFRNPLSRATPEELYRGMRMLNHGLRNLRSKIKDPSRYINIKRNGRRAIHGLAHLFGFRYICFLHDNPAPRDISEWTVMVSGLNAELRAVHSYPNMSSLLRSRYAKYIYISQIGKYYHPRRKHFVSKDRERLAELGTQKRYRFTAIFRRFGSKPDGRSTILLQSVTCNGTLVTNHVWFNATKSFKRLGHLEPGCQLRFSARVSLYKKGNQYDGSPVKHYDYGLSYPTRIERA